MYQENHATIRKLLDCVSRNSVITGISKDYFTKSLIIYLLFVQSVQDFCKVLFPGGCTPINLG